MTTKNVHFSSESDEWSTPDHIFADASSIWGPFDLDVCASTSNKKCAQYFNRKQDGLSQSWAGVARRVWMNPPYGRAISLWVRKALEESQKGCRVVCLLPARTDTKWFHELCSKGEVYFIKGRLKFGGCANSAPFPSMLVIFGQSTTKDDVTSLS